MEEPLHIHNFSTYTTLEDRHIHIMEGSTAPAAGGLDCHKHRFEGTTSVSDNHFHCFCGITSVAVPLTGGGHGHWFKGMTSLQDGHIHYFRWFTGPEIFVQPQTDVQQ